jgi:hypothetical protein
VEPYDSLDQAIGAVNNISYGLQAGVFTSNLQALFSAYERLRVGGVIANHASAFRTAPLLYGGTKDSGIGREGVRYAMQETTEPKGAGVICRTLGRSRQEREEKIAMIDVAHIMRLTTDRPRRPAARGPRKGTRARPSRLEQW